MQTVDVLIGQDFELEFATTSSQRSKETRTMRVQITNKELNENMRRLFKGETTGMECNNETAACLRD